MVLLSLLLSSAAVAAPVPRAQEEIVVTATRGRAVPRDRLGTSVTIIGRDTLAARQTRFVAEILRDAAGVSVNRPGPEGGLTSVRMRGTEANHVLVLFEGADISDPFQGEFDFSGLTADGIERIEILRGPQSALYGSDAVGGAINILARQGSGNTDGSLRAEGGDEGTWGLNGTAGSGRDGWDIFAAGSHYASPGSNVSRFGSEKDGTRFSTALVNAGFRPAPGFELRGFLRLVDIRAENDAQDFGFPARPTQGLVIDTDDVSLTRQVQAVLSASYTDELWQAKLTGALVRAERDSLTNGIATFLTEGSRDALAASVSRRFISGEADHRLTLAADWKRETFRNVPTGAPGPQHNRRTLETSGLVAGYDLLWGAAGFGASLRHDFNERFGDAGTWCVQASYSFETGTRLRASAGTGIKAPTNFELFGFNPTSFIGNPDLKPERSTGWDAGIEQSVLDGRGRLELTYFRATLRDEIFTAFLPGFVSSPRNRTTDSEQQGIEAALTLALADGFRLDAAWTWLDAKENGVEEVRRPEHSGSLSLSYDFAGDRASLGATLRYAGSQQDSEFVNATPQTRVTLPAFTTVNLYARYALSDALAIEGRVENLFDEDYEESFSYRSPGRRASLAITGRF
jgi:vitamin B12 transporter